MTTLSISKPASARAAAKHKDAPGAERINAAYAEFCETITIKALVIGQMLREQREAVCGKKQHNQHTSGDAQFSSWLVENCTIPTRTAYRWMEVAERSISACLLASLGKAQIEAGAIEVETVVIPFSQMMTATDAELPQSALAARQLLFDFVGDKTMKECLALVVVEGKEAHSITRAHNGRNAKGAGGSGDRKAYGQFMGVKWKHIVTFANSTMATSEKAKAIVATELGLEKCPRWYVEIINQKTAKELKLDDATRAARDGRML